MGESCQHDSTQRELLTISKSLRVSISAHLNVQGFWIPDTTIYQGTGQQLLLWWSSDGPFSNSCSKYYPRSFPFPPSEYTPYSGGPSWFLLLFLSLIWMNALTEINIRRSSQPCMSWVACLADDRQSRCVPRLRGWDRPHLPEWCWSSIYLDITGNILLDQGQCRVES